MCWKPSLTMSLTSLPFSILLLLSVSQVQGRHRGSITCKGDRLEGDKWFDGCQWCMCERGGPVCSPRECSENVAKVPPCDNLGSKWRDGCYDCRCGISGIECKADRACVARRGSGKKGQGDFLSGKCMEPMDHRCICGIDGVPSCSAEVIDITAYKSKQITMNVTRPKGLFRDRRFHHGYLARNSRSLRNGYDLESIPEDGGYFIRSRTKRRAGHRHSSTRLNPFLSRRLRAKFHRRNIDPIIDNFERSVDRADDANRLPMEANPSGAALVSGRDVRSQTTDNHLRSYRTLDDGRRSSYSRTYPRRGVPPTSTPSSLLVATDNRCRFGPRWYGGSLRCYCDVSGSVTCGDPSFVSTRIDGFRVENKPCENGLQWEATSSCRSCACHFSSLVVCKRSLQCPLPSLIRSSPQDDLFSRREEFRGGEEKEIRWSGGDDLLISVEEERDRRLESRGAYGGSRREDDFVDIEVDEDDDLPFVDGSGGNSRPLREDEPDAWKRRFWESEKARRGDKIAAIEGNDDIIIDLEESATTKPDLVIDVGERKHQVRHNKNIYGVSIGAKAKDARDASASTEVTVTSCTPGRRWRDGCLRCSCSPSGQRRCNDRRCPRRRRPSALFDNNSTIINDGGPRRMRPPVMSNNRFRPVSRTSGCGNYTVGDVYWLNCNKCRCTTVGPRCTAMSCSSDAERPSK